MSTLELKAYEIQFATQDKVNALISDAKVDLIKWMIGFWITQMAALIGLYLKG